MAAKDVIIRLGTYVAAFLWLVSGARIASGDRVASVKPHLSQNEISEAEAISKIGPVGEIWETGTLYVCMQKYQRTTGSFLNQYCFGNLKKAGVDVARDKLRIAEDISRCQNPKKTYKLQLCHLKGGRISIAHKKDVPKSCFSETAQEAVIATAVDETECKHMMELPEFEQAKFTKRPTSTIMSSITEDVRPSEYVPALEDVRASKDVPALENVRDLDEEDILASEGETKKMHTAEENKCDCGTGSVEEWEGKTCTCKPAPCEVAGTVGDGPDCACLPGLQGEIAWHGPQADGECTAEIKHLFTAEKEFLWEYKNESIKCCVSSLAGNPTYLQNMKASKLPTKGSAGRWTRTACGYMFGDTYHNGLVSREGANLTCPVPVTKIMKIAEKPFQEIKDLINLQEQRNN